MMYDLDILRIISNDVKPAEGKILISEPLLNDDFFGRSVVLLAREERESFLGFILNLQSGKLLSDVMVGIENEDIPLYYGGPVEQDVLFFIHTFDFIPGAVHICGNLYMDGDFEDIRKMINTGHANNSNIRFFIGNSGWSPGQLNDEISFNSWLVTSAPDEFIFGSDCDMWKKSMDYVDKRYEIWKNFPIDPELN